jgi:hypothetical protein
MAERVAKVLRIAAANDPRERRGTVVAAAAEAHGVFGHFEENWT